MDMVAERVKRARDENWQDQSEDGLSLRRTMSMAHLGGATLGPFRTKSGKPQRRFGS
jgi:formate dehydrogenase major subunit